MTSSTQPGAAPEDGLDPCEITKAASAKPQFDKAVFAAFTEEGRKAWADVPDAAAWVREIRGAESTSQSENPPTLHPRFATPMENVMAAFDQLLGATAYTFPLKGAAPNAGGVYVFQEDGIALYVGRTDNLQSRLGQHQRAASPANQASFAARIAREDIGREEATYLAETSRKVLHATDEFAQAFMAAKSRVRAMQVRFVIITDPVEQAVLEIYAATILGAPFSDFATH